MRARIAFKLAAIWLVVALPLALILGLTYQQWYETRVSLVQEQRLGYARLSATSFRLLVAEIQRTLHLSGLDMMSREATSAMTALELDRLESIYPAAYVALTDVNGTVIAASEPGITGRNLADHEALQQALSSPSGAGIEPSEENKNGVVGFHVAERIEATPDRSAGAIMLLVDVRLLSEQFPVAVPTGGISVIDSEGQVVFQNEDVRLALKRERWGDRFPFVASAMSGSPATTRDFDFPLGGRRIGAFVPIDSTGWAAGSAVNADEALAPFYRGLRWGVPLSALLAALGLLTSGWISYRIRASLVTLADHAERIGRGELDEAVSLERSDEIGELAVSLEEARRNLRTYAAANEHLLERERESARLNAGLTDVDSILHSTLAFREILARVLERSCEAIGCDAAGVNLREGNQWVRAALIGLEPAFLGQRMPDESNPISTLIRETMQPVIITDAVADPRMPDAFVEQYGIRTSMAFPMIVRGSVVGVVFFNHLAELRPFTEEQIDFATRLSVSLALAHENALLYEAERDVAEKLQSALLLMPNHVEGVTFACAYRSASITARVGGDFYDLFSLADGRVGITIGDIAGHGIDAALLTSLAKNAIRVKATDPGSTPASVMSTANDVLLRDSAPEVFATVFFALLDPASGALTYCSAGHTTSLRVGLDGAVTELGSNGSIIGAFDDMAYSNVEIRLGEGELLFLYTDGLTEARGAEGLYGEARLAELLSTQACHEPQAVVDAAMASVLTYAGGHLGDDVAMLAITRWSGA